MTLLLCKILSHALSQGVSTLAADGFIFTLLSFTWNLTGSDANLVIQPHLPLPLRVCAMVHISIRTTKRCRICAVVTLASVGLSPTKH